MKKIYDLVVKVGSYQKDGQEKGRYENVGSLMENDKGKFIFLKKTFNPAGLNTDDRESIIVSMFEPKSRNGNVVDSQVDTAPGVSDMENPFSDDDTPF